MIDTWITPFQQKNASENTRRSWVYFSGWNSVMYVSITVHGRENYFLFVLWNKQGFWSFVTSSMSLFKKSKLFCRVYIAWCKHEEKVGRIWKLLNTPESVVNGTIPSSGKLWRRPLSIRLSLQGVHVCFFILNVLMLFQVTKREQRN